MSKLTATQLQTVTSIINQVLDSNLTMAKIDLRFGPAWKVSIDAGLSILEITMTHGFSKEDSIGPRWHRTSTVGRFDLNHPGTGNMAWQWVHRTHDRLHLSH